MKKQLKKIGNSMGIIFNREDVKIYGFVVGQIIEIEPIIIIPKKTKR